MFGLGLPELLIILLILLLLFGSKKLPKLAKSLGEAAGELQKGFSKSDAPSNAKKTTRAKKSNKS